MGQVVGGVTSLFKTPKIRQDPDAAAARELEAENARKERARLAAGATEEATAQAGGRRGRRSLLSAMGELGFPTNLGSG